VSRPKQAVRIAIVVPTHWGYLMGGSQYQAQLLSDVLETRNGVEVAYFAGRLPPKEVIGDRTVFRAGRVHRLRRYGHFWDYFSLPRQLRAYRPDLVYQRVCCAHTGICARYARRHGVPMIWHVSSDRDCWSRPKARQLLARPHKLIESRLSVYGMRNATYVVAQTETQARLLRENFGIEAAAVMPNFHPQPDDTIDKSGPLTLLWIANFKNVKRPELILEIAAAIRDMDQVRIKVIGSPFPESARQARFEKAVGELDNIEYLGRLRQEEVNRRLCSAHLLINTSFAEGFSNTFVQAWMREVPIVTIGVNPDGIFDDEVLGRSCTSVTEAAQFIRLLLGDRARLLQMGTEARTRSISMFSMRNAEKLADFIVDAAGSNAGNRRRTQPA